MCGNCHNQLPEKVIQIVLQQESILVQVLWIWCTNKHTMSAFLDKMLKSYCIHVPIDAHKLHIHPLPDLRISIQGLISPANAREICKWLHISDISNNGVDWHQCMMSNTQNAVLDAIAHCSIMYKDWCLSVPQKWKKFNIVSDDGSQ